MADIKNAIDELINGIQYEDEYYTQILDKMVINDKNHIDVYLKMLPHKWSFTVAKGVTGALETLAGKRPLEAPPAHWGEKSWSLRKLHFWGFTTYIVLRNVPNQTLCPDARLRVRKLIMTSLFTGIVVFCEKGRKYHIFCGIYTINRTYISGKFRYWRKTGIKIL